MKAYGRRDSRVRFTAGKLSKSPVRQFFLSSPIISDSKRTSNDHGSLTVLVEGKSALHSKITLIRAEALRGRAVHVLFSHRK
ncbi:hypothetical protein PQX77_001738 [Marasmius sp. AFHP31]|nr:hypothetical protein PQX77_001738 [Marasmius sp. AFHP31]